jgi:hypothetical protein
LSVADDRYITAMGGGGPFDLQRMCRRCGALVGSTRPGLPEGTVTSEMAHDAFHDRLDALAEEIDRRLAAKPPANAEGR